MQFRREYIQTDVFGPDISQLCKFNTSSAGCEDYPTRYIMAKVIHTQDERYNKWQDTCYNIWVYNIHISYIIHIKERLLFVIICTYKYNLEFEANMRV